MKRSEELKEDILSEIEKIENLFNSFTPLTGKLKKQNPSFIELNALAMFLHSFYNGLENIFKLIAKKIDEKNLTSERWHIELLDQMTNTTKNRKKSVLTNKTYEVLKEYLGFRHFSRHAYSFDLNWDLMKDLIYNIEEIKDITVKEIRLFIEEIIE